MIKLGQFCWHGNPFSFACILRSRVIFWCSCFLLDHFEFHLSKLCKTSGVFCQFGKQYYYHDHHVTHLYQDRIGLSYLVFTMRFFRFVCSMSMSISFIILKLISPVSHDSIHAVIYVVEISCLKIHSTLCKGLSLHH